MGSLKRENSHVSYMFGLQDRRSGTAELELKTQPPNVEHTHEHGESVRERSFSVRREKERKLPRSGRGRWRKKAERARCIWSVLIYGGTQTITRTLNARSIIAASRTLSASGDDASFTEEDAVD